MALRYRESKKDIKDLIKGIKPNHKIPSRAWLSNKLCVARATVDKAIRELVSEGNLYAIPGSGTFVSDGGPGEKIQNWGVVLPNIIKEIYPDLLRGIEDFASSNQINIVICNSDNSALKQQKYVDRLISSEVDGCIVVPSIYAENNYGVYEKFIKEKIPIVFCCRCVWGIKAPFITTNNYYGAYLATKHLINSGCKRIAYISEVKYITSMDRLYGYAAALNTERIEVDNKLVLLCNRKDQKFKEAVIELLEKESPVDGVFCFNDNIASIVYPILSELGYRIGENISVVGYDNTQLASGLLPPLTSVTFRSKEIGFCAANCLYELIQGNYEKQDEVHFFDPYIVERESCMIGKKNTEREKDGKI